MKTKPDAVSLPEQAFDAKGDIKPEFYEVTTVVAYPEGTFGLVEARTARWQCGLEGRGPEGLVIGRAQAFINSVEPALRRGY